MNEIIMFNSCFDDIMYHDDTHTYVKTDGTVFPSVTKILSNLTPEFDSRFWSVYKSFKLSGYEVKDNRNGTITVIKDSQEFILNPYFTNEADLNIISPQTVLEMWAYDAKEGSTRGSFIHTYLEELLKRKLHVVKHPIFNSPYCTHEVFQESLDKLKNICNSFYHEVIYKNYVVVAQEFVVYDDDYEIAGTFDLLLYNRNTKEYELWDFKTDKDINKKGFHKFRFFGLTPSLINKYSLQLGIYKNIINKNTPIKINSCFIAHFNRDENKYSIIKAHDFDNEIEQFLKNGEHKSTHI